MLTALLEYINLLTGSQDKKRAQKNAQLPPPLVGGPSHICCIIQASLCDFISKIILSPTLWPAA